jgi:hypothetical protein
MIDPTDAKSIHEFAQGPMSELPGSGQKLDFDGGTQT